MTRDASNAGRVAEGNANTRLLFPLESVVAAPPFAAIDRRFSEFILRLADGDELVALAAAVASWRSRVGNVCADLRALAGTAPGGDDGECEPAKLPPFESWEPALLRSALVGHPGDFKPLVLDAKGRLYLHRYWQYEKELAADILRRAQSVPEGMDWSVFAAGLRRLFATSPAGEVDWQRVACFAALRRRLCVITGGPGTGKTRTAAVLIALLLEQPGAERLRVALAAPTGKAAARLAESVQASTAALPLDASVRARMPVAASTLHRLLRVRENRATPHFHAANPLPLDAVVVDEASMVDLAMMAKLFAALPPAARVVLLGDKDQLASVEAGAVLADICSGAENRFSNPFAAECERMTGAAVPIADGAGAPGALRDCVVQLERNYRFGGGREIVTASRAVNGGDAAGALAAMTGGGAISWRALPAALGMKDALRDLVLRNFVPGVTAKDPVEALQQFGRFRILCAVRRGPFGVTGINRLVEEILAEEGAVAVGRAHYPGRPLIVLENDYDVGLFNGDHGVVGIDANGGMMVSFLRGDGTTRVVVPARLPRHETAFALTIHKSQGSEFESTLVILPDQESPVLSRELVYTGLTRASQRVELWAPGSLLAGAIHRRLARASGLADFLGARGYAK